jgi:hypothetical protein
MSEQLSPEANAQVAFLLGLLHERQAAAQEAIASRESSPNDGASSDAPRGTIRPCPDDNNEDGLAPNLHANNASSLTLEEGRALKRAKVLTTESDLEAEEFLKVYLSVLDLYLFLTHVYIVTQHPQTFIHDRDGPI